MFRIPFNIVLNEDQNETWHVSKEQYLGVDTKQRLMALEYFNRTWLPNWNRLYERFKQFQLNNPGCNEWMCFDLETELELAKYPSQIVTSSYNLSNENSNREVSSTI